MKWTQWLSAAVPAGLLVMAGCADKDPVSSTQEEGLSGSSPAGKLVTTKNRVTSICEHCPFPAVIDLPAGFRPENMDTGRGTTFYVGSIRTGSIYKGDLKTGEGAIIALGAGVPSLGVFYEERGNRLFVAGRQGGGTGLVYDADTGEQLAAYPFPDAQALNDVVVTNKAAYFTDTKQPFLYVVPLGPQGELPAESAVAKFNLSGEYQFDPNAPTPIPGNVLNNNGITATPDGKYLVLSNMGLRTLYRVDPVTGVSKAIKLDQELPMPHVDGIHLDGQNLYVALNFSSKIVEIRLAPDLSSGTVTRTINSWALDVPSDLFHFGNNLYALNARFTTTPELTTPYTLVRMTK